VALFLYNSIIPMGNLTRSTKHVRGSMYERPVYRTFYALIPLSDDF